MLRFLFSKNNLQNVKVYNRYIKIGNKKQIDQDVDEDNVRKYNSLEEYQYYFYRLLQEQSRKGFVKDDQYLKAREQVKEVLIKEQDNLKQDDFDQTSLSLIIDYDLHECIQLMSQSSLSNNSQQLQIEINFRNLSTFTQLLSKLILNQQNIPLQTLLFDRIIEFVVIQLQTRVYSISNEHFNDVLKAISILAQTNLSFNIDLPKRIGFNYIQDKLNDYEKVEELIEVEYMIPILYHSQLISQLTQHKWKINLSKYDQLFNLSYKTLDTLSIFQLSSFYLMALKYDSLTTSRFFEQFYFQVLSTTQYYYKEYLIRKLGIYNFDLPLLQLVRTAVTRLYLLNTTQKEPRFRKHIELLPEQKLELARLMLQNVQYRNSPLIMVLLSDSVNQISQMYVENVGLDYVKEKNILHAHYRQILRVLSLWEQSFDDSKDCYNLLKMVMNYFSLHSQAFTQQMMLDLLSLVNRILSSNSTLHSKLTYLAQLQKDKQYLLFLDIFKSKLLMLFANSLNEKQIVNNQQTIIPTLHIFKQILSEHFIACSPYFKYIAHHLDKLHITVKLEFIHFLNDYYDTQPKEIAHLMQIIINTYANTETLSESYDLKVKFLTLFMRIVHLLDDSTREILDSKINDLMSFQINDINENNILTTIQLFLIAQQQQIITHQLESVQDVFFRIISDRHSAFSLSNYELIVSSCMQLNNFDKNFDDGSECYTQTLLEELRQFNTDNFSKFTPHFQKLIEPYVSLEDTTLNKYLQSFKEKVSDYTQNMP